MSWNHDTDILDIENLINIPEIDSPFVLSYLASLAVTSPKIIEKDDKVIVTKKFSPVHPVFKESSTYLEETLEIIDVDFAMIDSSNMSGRGKLGEKVGILTVEIPIEKPRRDVSYIEIQNGIRINRHNQSISITDDFDPTDDFIQFLSHMIWDTKYVNDSKMYILDCGDTQLSCELVADIYSDFNPFIYSDCEEPSRILINDTESFDLLITEKIGGFLNYVDINEQKRVSRRECPTCNIIYNNIEKHWNTDECHPPTINDRRLNSIIQLLKGIIISGGSIKQEYSGNRVIYQCDAETAQSLSRVLHPICEVYETKYGEHIIRSVSHPQINTVLEKWVEEHDSVFSSETLGPVTIGTIIDLCAEDSQNPGSNIKLDIPETVRGKETEYGVSGKYNSDGLFELHLSKNTLENILNATCEREVIINSSRKHLIAQDLLVKPGYINIMSETEFLHSLLRQFSRAQVEKSDKTLEWG